MNARHKILEWAEEGRIASGQLAAALKTCKLLPDQHGWLQFLDRLLLGLGTLLLVSGIIFFFAANWDGIGRFTRFALVEAAFLVCLLLLWRLGSTSLAGQAALAGAVLLTGVLLALVGQTYQTGADNWELFFAWSLLVFPWVALGKNSILWLIWLGLINLCTITYARAHQGLFWEDDLLWLLFSINTLALVLWQKLADLEHIPANAHWPIRLLATASGACITLLALQAVVDSASTASIMAWLIWLGTIYYVYRRQRVDLYILTGGVLSIVVTTSVFFTQHLLTRNSVFSLVLLTMLVLGLSAAGGWWLRKILEEMHRQ